MLILTDNDVVLTPWSKRFMSKGDRIVFLSLPEVIRSE